MGTNNKKNVKNNDTKKKTVKIKKNAPRYDAQTMKTER